MKLFKACIAMAAFAAIFVVPPIAQGSLTLTHPTGTTAPVGTEILATNVAHSSTIKNTVMTTAVGNVECATATITGKVVKNDGNHIVGTISTAEFRSTPGTDHKAAHCTAPGGFGTTTVTPNHTTNPCHTPSGGTPHCSLPWCITSAGEKDEFEVFAETGGSCTSGEKGRITFTLHTTFFGECKYEKATPVIGTYTTHPADLIATIKDQEFTRNSTSSGFCPAVGKLDMAFTLATDKSGVSGEAIYISKGL